MKEEAWIRAGKSDKTTVGQWQLEQLEELQLLQPEEPIEVTETVLFGEPALRAKSDSSTGWGIAIMGFRKQEAFLLSIEAPTAEALDEFLPTWEKMLESIEASGGQRY